MTFHIFGYYDRSNLGDEQFKLTIPFALKKQGITNQDTVFHFVNHKTIHDSIFKEGDTIILGGGDVLTFFFLDKLQEIIDTLHVKCHLIAFCVGVSFTSELEHPLLQQFESFYIRTFQDIVIFKKLFKNVYIIPDTSFLLPQMDIKSCTCCTIKSQDTLPYLLVCLNQHSFHDFPIIHFSKLLDILSQNYHIDFIPFCTDEEDPLLQNDTILHESIASKMSCTNYTIYKKSCLKTTLDLFKRAEYSIVMRFHALLFSYISNVEFLLISDTRKTQNFFKDVSIGNKIKTLKQLEEISENKIKKILEKKMVYKLKYQEWKQCVY